MHEVRQLVVDGITTRYLEAGQGSDVVLLHSGEFGASAEISWELIIGALAERHHVIAPDWLGFGGTDKVKDFVDGHGRMLRHMARTCEALGIEAAHFVGNSMGATFLVRDAAADAPILPALSLVVASGGGFAPENDARRALLDYDCSLEGMRRIVEAMFHDPAWAADDDYVRRRWESSIVPGAWECAAAARFRSPVAPVRSDFGAADTTPYGRVGVPTHLVAGAQDKLRIPGYADELGAAIQGAVVSTFDQCGHCPNIERPEDFSDLVLGFVAAVEDPGPRIVPG